MRVISLFPDIDILRHQCLIFESENYSRMLKIHPILACVLFAMGIVTVLTVIIQTRALNSRFEKDISNCLPSSHILDSSFLSIIDPASLNEVRINSVQNTKLREPVALIERNNTNMLLMRLKLTSERKPGHLLKFQKGNIKESNNVTYQIVPFSSQANLSFNLTKGPPQDLTSIIIRAEAESKVNWQSYFNSDSLISVSILAKKISLRYSEKDAHDIFIETNNISDFSDASATFNLMFQRHGSFIFIIISCNAQNISQDLRRDSLFRFQ